MGVVANSAAWPEGRVQKHIKLLALGTAGRDGNRNRSVLVSGLH